MGSVLKWIGRNLWSLLVALFGLLLTALGIQTARVKNKQAKVEKQEEVITHLEDQVDLEQSASDIKDELVVEEAKIDEMEAEAHAEVATVAEPKELSDGVKKLAAAQAARASARGRSAHRVSD